jgi:hypothetical protein
MMLKGKVQRMLSVHTGGLLNEKARDSNINATGCVGPIDGCE